MQWGIVRRFAYRGLGFGLLVVGLVMAAGAGNTWG